MCVCEEFLLFVRIKSQSGVGKKRFRQLISSTSLRVGKLALSSEKYLTGDSDPTGRIPSTQQCKSKNKGQDPRVSARVYVCACQT